MDLEASARVILVGCLLACLWFARVAWKEAEAEGLLFRVTGTLLWLAAASTIFYGLVR